MNTQHEVNRKMLNGPHWLSFIILDYKHAFFPKKVSNKLENNNTGHTRTQRRTDTTTTYNNSNA